MDVISKLRILSGYNELLAIWTSVIVGCNEVKRKNICRGINNVVFIATIQYIQCHACHNFCTPVHFIRWLNNFVNLVLMICFI